MLFLAVSDEEKIQDIPTRTYFNDGLEMCMFPLILRVVEFQLNFNAEVFIVELH